jgi:hypothetical protein
VKDEEDPTGPPPLVAMGARKETLETVRGELFRRWKVALEAAGGNVSAAAAALRAAGDATMTRDRGNRLTRRFKLVGWAAGLREQATGHARGRQDRKSRPQKG